MERLLVVGATGTLGRAVVSRWRSRDLGPVETTSRVAPTGLAGHHRLDPTDIGAFEQLVRSRRPDAIIVAAGQIFGEPDDLLTVARRVTEASIRAAEHCPVVVIGSSAEYGAGPSDGAPSREDDADDPRTPYAHARAAATDLVRHAQSEGLPIVVGRVTNVISSTPDPRQPLGEWLNAIATLPDNAAIEVGNAATRRDFVRASDAAEALIALVRPRPADGAIAPEAVVNVASGIGTAFGDLVEALVRAAGRPLWVHDLGRPLPIPVVVADPTRLADGWGLRLAASPDQLAAATLSLGETPNDRWSSL